MKSFDQSLFSHSEISITLQLKGWKMVWPNTGDNLKSGRPPIVSLAFPATVTSFPQVFPQRIYLKWLTLKVQLLSLWELFQKLWPLSWFSASSPPLEIFSNYPNIISSYYVNKIASMYLPTINTLIAPKLRSKLAHLPAHLPLPVAVVFPQSSPWVTFRVNSQSSLTHHVPQNEWDTRMTALTPLYPS